jgi:beta-fructofuranosidase
VPVRLIPGAKRRLLDASPSAEEPWYINDHTLVRAADGRWHVFGIWHPEPAAPLDETCFLHASAADLDGAEWTVHDPVLHARSGIGETHVWAPHVIAHDGRYRMFYAGGTEDHSAYRITLATSEDLFTWTVHEPVLFEDGYDARDPMVLRAGERWLMYFTRTSSPEGGFHEVAVRESEDLVTWSEARVAYRSTVRGTVGGPTESPFVVPAGEGWILFVCESDEYDRTLAYHSRDPLVFTDEGRIDVDLDEHCAEIVADGERTWITGGGWGRGGLTIRPLEIRA